MAVAAGRAADVAKDLVTPTRNASEIIAVLNAGGDASSFAKTSLCIAIVQEDSVDIGRTLGRRMGGDSRYSLRGRRAVEKFVSECRSFHWPRS